MFKKDLNRFKVKSHSILLTQSIHSYAASFNVKASNITSCIHENVFHQ